MKLEDSGPVFFLQERLGLGGQTFRIWKFRSMVPDADRLLDASGEALVPGVRRPADDEGHVRLFLEHVESVAEAAVLEELVKRGVEQPDRPGDSSR